jgi:hypothetical protein
MTTSMIRVDRQNIWVAVKPGEKVWRTLRSDGARTFFAGNKRQPSFGKAPGTYVFRKAILTCLEK